MQYCIKYFSTEIQIEIVSSRSLVDSTLYPNMRSRVQHIMYLPTEHTHMVQTVVTDASGGIETREGMVNGHGQDIVCSGLTKGNFITLPLKI